MVGLSKRGGDVNVPTNKKWLVVFDMDGTLLPGTTAAQEISRIAGVLDEIRELEVSYSLSRLDSLEFSHRALKLWRLGGEDIYHRAWQAAPKLANIDKMLNVFRARGAVTCLITMAPVEFARNFSGFDHVYGSEYGKTILNPEDKPRIVAALSSDYGIAPEQVVVFGDSHSDLPLFEKALHSVSVNGSHEICERACHQYTGFDISAAAALVFPNWF